VIDLFYVTLSSPNFLPAVTSKSG